MVSKNERLVQINKLNASGYTINQIARKLKLQPNTIKKYLSDVKSLSKNSNRNSISLCIEILGLIIAVSSIWLTFYFSSPINLEVWENISETEGRLYIYAHNNDWLRSTGPMDIYRLEVNPDKPHIQIYGNKTLKARETKQIASLIIRVNESKRVIIADEIWQKFSIPASLLYFVTEDRSISYRVTCDNCRQDGIVRRIPDVGEINPTIVIEAKNNRICISIPVYEWETKKLEDLYTTYPSCEK